MSQLSQVHVVYGCVITYCCEMITLCQWLSAADSAGYPTGHHHLGSNSSVSMVKIKLCEK